MVSIDVKSVVRLAGGTVFVARALGLTHSAVSQWRRVPAQHASKVADLAKIKPHDVRPDVFPREAA